MYWNMDLGSMRYCRKMHTGAEGYFTRNVGIFSPDSSNIMLADFGGSEIYVRVWKEMS